jgi:hypothetical protein
MVNQIALGVVRLIKLGVPFILQYHVRISAPTKPKLNSYLPTTITKIFPVNSADHTVQEGIRILGTTQIALTITYKHRYSSEQNS